MSEHTHEWPLVAFTSLAVAGAGIVAVQPLSWAAGPPATPGWNAVRLWGPGLIALGLLVSLAHLGQPARLLQVRRRAGRSELSNEVILATATAAAAAVASLVPNEHLSSTGLQLLAAVLALAFLISLGLVYRLRGQHAWRGASAAGPVTSGVALGVMILAAGHTSENVLAMLLAVFFVGLDAGVFAVRWVGLGRLDPSLEPAHSPLFPWRHVVLGLRVALFDVLSLGLLLAGREGAAVAALSAGLVVDRLAFYGLAVQHTTEAEIARVEGVIAELDSLSTNRE